MVGPLRITMSVVIYLVLAAGLAADIRRPESGLLDLPVVPPSPSGNVATNDGDQVITLGASHLDERLNRLEADLQSIKNLIDSPSAADFPCDRRVAQTVPWRVCNPLRVGAELLIAKPRFEDGAEEDDQTNLTDFKLDVSPRVWLAIVSPSGGGWRGRYWQFGDTSANEPRGGERETMRLEAYNIDLEYIQELTFGPWSCTIGMGGRNAWFQQEVELRNSSEKLSKTFHAAGPMASATFVRNLGHSGLAVIGKVHGAVLAGEAKWRDSLQLQATDDIGSILEMQIGMEWHTHKRKRGQLFVRGFWEHQYWAGVGTFFDGQAAPATGALNIEPDDHDVALMGFGFAAGLRR